MPRGRRRPRSSGRRRSALPADRLQQRWPARVRPALRPPAHRGAGVADREAGRDIREREPAARAGVAERGRAEHRVARAAGARSRARSAARAGRARRRAEARPCAAPGRGPRSRARAAATPPTGPSSAAYRRASERASVTAFAAGISAARAARVLSSRPIGKPSSICGATRGSNACGSPIQRSNPSGAAISRAHERTHGHPGDTADQLADEPPPGQRVVRDRRRPGSQAGRIRARARTQRSKSSGSAGTKPASPAVCESTCATVTAAPRTPASTPRAGRPRTSARAPPARAPRLRRRPWCTTRRARSNRGGRSRVDDQLAVAIDRELRRARVVAVRRGKGRLKRQISGASGSGRSIGTNAYESGISTKRASRNCAASRRPSETGKQRSSAPHASTTSPANDDRARRRVQQQPRIGPRDEVRGVAQHVAIGQRGRAPSGRAAPPKRACSTTRRRSAAAARRRAASAPPRPPATAGSDPERTAA